MINIYSPEEIAVIRESGRITAEALQKALKMVAPGVTTLELDKFIDDQIQSSGGKPSFKMEKGYYYATCMCVNDVVVHGIPTKEELRPGDILGIDLGTFYKGFHSDASWSVIVGRKNKNHPDGENERFLKAGEEALFRAIKECRPGNHIGDISKAIQDTVEGAGYSCVKQLVGHGVGKVLHGDPEIPCFQRGAVGNTPLIKTGMVLAIEVIYNQGASPIVYANDDGWTIVTRDRKPSGLFEHTVAVREKGAEILTLAHEAKV